jgi:WD40 repeat protein
MQPTSKTGVTFITTGTITGAGIFSTVGGMGIAGSFGAVGIGATAVTAAGGVVGAALYGAFTGITTGDQAPFSTMGIGAIGGFGFSQIVGSIGFVAPKIGLAYGIGAASMTGIGAVLGLAAYGVFKVLDNSQFQETPMQVFERMETKVLEMDYYNAALLELDLFLSGDDINQKFADLEMEDELEKFKATINDKSNYQSLQVEEQQVENKNISLNNQLPKNWECVKTLKGHFAKVNAVAIHPNGNSLISGSDDKQVILWDLKTGKILYNFVGQGEAVLSVAISPDGKEIISGSVDRKISSWQLETKKFNRTFYYLNNTYSHHGFVNAVAYSGDHRIIVSGSTDTKIIIWGRHTGQYKRILNGHTKAVLAIAISPDNKTLVSGSADKTIRIWNLQTGEQRFIINEHLAEVNTLAITPDGKILLSGSRDKTIKIWNLDTGELYCTFIQHSTEVLAIAIHPDGKTIASSSQDGIIKLWNLQNGEILETLSGFSPLVFSPDGKMLVSGGKSGTIKIWQQLKNRENVNLTGEWWEILGVDKNAHGEDVKIAYRKLARLYHPDINNTDTAKAAMQAINQAYQHFQRLVNVNRG